MSKTAQHIADLGAPIAFGRTAEIYAWQPGWVLKLFLPHYTRNGVQYELDVARRVLATGLRVPASGEIVAIDDRLGIPYERIDGVTMWSRLNAEPAQGPALIRQLGMLHATIHTRVAATLPDQRLRLTGKIEAAKPLPPALRAKALAVLAALPSDQRLCHGDFHPDNILLTDQQPVIIDWNDATAGHPAADVARTLLLMRFAGLPEEPVARRAQQAQRAMMRGLYLEAYGQQTLDAALLQQWLIPITAARLAENTTDSEADLLHYLEQLCRT
jgi:aminoglycoside phosphotransferase (APT) family kinase protein